MSNKSMKMSNKSKSGWAAPPQMWSDETDKGLLVDYGSLYTPSPPPDPPITEPAVKVTVVNPIAEIRRLMDEVLFKPEIVAARREMARLEKILELAEAEATQAKKIIREYFRQIQAKQDQPDYGEDSLDSEGENVVINSPKGSIFFYGGSGPFIADCLEAKEEK